MGFDTSYHPIDLDFVHRTLVPYILGETTIDSLRPAMRELTRLEEIRVRARHWRLDTYRMGQELDVPLDFDLHVAGRPFFILSTDPVGVVERFEEYQNLESPEHVDQLAYRTLKEFSDVLAEKVEVPTPPRMIGPEQMFELLTSELTFFRKAFAAVQNGVETIPNLDGEMVCPRGALERHLYLSIVRFCAHLIPGWMTRGTVWPSLLADMAGISKECFLLNSELLGPLVDAAPQLKFEPEASISENYSVGGVVKSCPELRQALNLELPKLIGSLGDQRQAEHLATCHVKLNEALLCAERRGIAFVEVTDIYEPFSDGMLN